MIEFKEESFKECVRELLPIIRLHWEEIARNKDDIKLSVDWLRYFALEDAGVLHFVTARHEGVLVGYVITFIMPHLHYKEWKFSDNDILYLTKEHRGAGNGRRMLEFTEQKLIERGVNVIHYSMKIAHDFGPLMEKIGYKEIERVYEKFIE